MLSQVIRLSVVAGLLCCVCPGLARASVMGPITIEPDVMRYSLRLDGLLGTYSTGDWGPVRRTGVFDFGRQFENIESVRIRIAGTIAPGLSRDDRDAANIIDSQIISFPSLSMQDVGQVELPRASLNVQGSFDVETYLWRPILNPITHKWSSAPNFIREGRGEVGMDIGAIGQTGFGRQIVPVLAGVSDAYVIVDVRVPEPGSLGALAIGAVVLLVSRYRPRRA